MSWKLVVRGLKSKIEPERKHFIEDVIRQEAGEAVLLRVARRGLLLMALDALSGRPRLIAVRQEGFVCVISFGDLLEVLAEPGPTLEEVMATVRRSRVEIS